MGLVCRGPQEACTKGDNHRAEQAIDRGAEGLPGSHGASPPCIPRRRDVSFTAPCHYALHCMLHLCAAAYSMSFHSALPNSKVTFSLLYQQHMCSLLLLYFLRNFCEVFLMLLECPAPLATAAVLLCCRPAADAASSSAPGLAAETILEDEPDQDDVAPTPEQLEVKLLIDMQSTQTAVLS